MCGIYARMGPRDDELDRRATLSLYHRGPDHVGLLVDPAPGSARHCVTLGHTRLSIVDLSPSGHQPMRSADGDLALAYNGEIYNHRELRRELDRGGAHFRSDSDTEVLLHLYRAHGDALLDRIEGMYAFVLWDRSARRLLAARDPSGIKPLFFRREWTGTATGDALAIGSEIKALLVDPRFARRPDLQALTGYLSHLHTSAPLTAFEGIESLLPGHKLVVRDDAGSGAKIAIERFHRFTLAPKQSFGSLANAADELERLLTQVVDQHMIADVPLGAFLSAGVDSSLLVALMARIKRERGDQTRVQTVTVGFGEEGRQYDEAADAARIARQLGVEHRILRVDGDRIGERVPHVAMQFDEPFGIPTALLHDVLCEAARKEITVALAGDGGDEAFGGYPRHRAARSLSTYTRLLPRSLREDVLPQLAGFIPERTDVNPVLRRARRFLNSAGRDFPTAYREWLSYYTEPELDELLTPESRAASKLPRESLSEAALRDTEEPAGRFDPLDRACLADVYGFLPGVVLQDSDRSSMRVALEVRVPYADRRILDFGLRLPPDLKIPGNLAALVPGGRSTSKAVLRAVAARYLPEKSSNAPKQGFVAPMGTWLNGPLRDLMEEATRPATVEARGVVRPSAVAAMREAHAGGSRDRTWQLWALVVMESWFQQRIDQLALPDRSGQQVSVEVLAPAA